MLERIIISIATRLLEYLFNRYEKSRAKDKKKQAKKEYDRKLQDKMRDAKTKQERINAAKDLLKSI